MFQTMDRNVRPALNIRRVAFAMDDGTAQQSTQ